MVRSWLVLQRSGSADITRLWAAALLVCGEGKWCRSGEMGLPHPTKITKAGKGLKKPCCQKEQKPL